MTLRERRGFASPGVPVGEPSPLPAAETFGSFGAEEAESQLAWHGCAGPDVRFVALPLQVSRHASAVSVRVRSDDGSTLFELDDPSDFRRWALVRLVLPDSAEGRCFTIEAGEHDPDGRAFIAVGTPHIVR